MILQYIQAYYGLFNWENVSMDFVDGLPKLIGKEVIFMVVDKLSKYARLMALAHLDSTMDVAQSYLDNVYKLYGWP